MIAPIPNVFLTFLQTEVEISRIINSLTGLSATFASIGDCIQKQRTAAVKSLKRRTCRYKIIPLANR
jgi:hypothetical protein